jgi:2-iminoacetate synthase ThiH
MADIPITQAELLRDIHRRVIAIERQVVATNGRVNALETWRDRGIGAAAVIVLIVVPIFLNMIATGTFAGQ